tara:strand:- start:15267 stop:15473 length:207 start_codon:yes stop_codon:yes gene_type:complete
MLDLRTTKKISCGDRKQFTFLLKDKYALKGYILCSYLAKSKKDAVLKMENERDHNFDTESGDIIVKTS